MVAVLPNWDLEPESRQQFPDVNEVETIDMVGQN